MLSRLVIVFLPRTMRSLSDLIHHTRRKSGHSDQEATVMAPLAHVHFQNTGCQACLCSLTFIITLWGKQSSSSYLTHKEIETVSGLGNGRQNCKAVKSTSHGIGWMWVGFRLCCLLAVWLWVLASLLWAAVFSSVKWEWWCPHRFEGKSKWNNVCKMLGPVLGVPESAAVIQSTGISWAPATD